MKLSCQKSAICHFLCSLRILTCTWCNRTQYCTFQRLVKGSLLDALQTSNTWQTRCAANLEHLTNKSMRSKLRTLDKQVYAGIWRSGILQHIESNTSQTLQSPILGRNLRILFIPAYLWSKSTSPGHPIIAYSMAYVIVPSFCFLFSMALFHAVWHIVFFWNRVVQAGTHQSHLYPFSEVWTGRIQVPALTLGQAGPVWSVWKWVTSTYLNLPRAALFAPPS